MNVAARPALDAADRLDPGSMSGAGFISLCTGGGGLDLGLELAMPGARPVCYVEREAFACAHLVAAIEAGLMADAPLWSDARTFDGRRWRGAVDGVIGGIPCQPHSLAGRRKGAADARDLWSVARRIIVQSRAWFVLIENVGGMLTAPRGQMPGAERVWRDLRRLGFSVEIGLFSAAEVGASHGRERVFILGVADPGRAEGRARPPGRDIGDRAKTGRLEGSGRSAESGQGVADARRGAGSAQPELEHGARPDQPRRGEQGLAHADRQRSQGLGADARAQGQAGQHPDRPGGDGRLFPPVPDDRAAWAAIADGDPALLPALSRHDRFRLALGDARLAEDGHPGAGAGLLAQRAEALRAPGVPAPAQPDVRRVAHGLAVRMDDVGAWSRTERLAMLGNGVVPLQAAYAVRTLVARLAARDAPSADRLVRMMEAAE